jgi:hypothetical protein
MNAKSPNQNREMLRANSYNSSIDHPGAVLVEDAKVLSLDADASRYRVEGNVDVMLIHGSKSDRVEFEENL